MLTSNQKTGSITLETALPFGLGATPTLCIENCTTGLYINGTPATGDGWLPTTFHSTSRVKMARRLIHSTWLFMRRHTLSITM